MKKLLIALAAAATTAIGAYAEGWTTGTPFSLESGSPGELGSAFVQELTVDPTVAASASGFWTGLTNTVEVKAFESGTPAPMDRFGSYAHLNYLSVKTAFGEPVFRNAQVNGTAYDMALDGNGNIYFEGNVKFTACDETPEIASDAKIALYLKDLSDVDTNPAAETNLYVNIGGTEYNCGNNIIEVDDWTKLTIKMLNIDGAGKIGFVIFLNDVATPLSPAEGTIAMPAGITLTNVAQSYADKNCLFPAAGDGTTITGIGFAGQGAVDQIAFTTENLVPDPSICEVTLGAGVDTLTITDSDGKTVAFTADGWFEYDADKSYTYTYTAKSGFVPLTTPQDFNPAEGLDVPDADGAVAAIDDVMYATVAEAIADVNEGETVKLLEDAGAIAINKDGVAFTLDLADCNVTTEEGDDAITLTAGTLTITNSVDGLGGVVSAGEEGYAVYVEAGEITIAGGKYDSAIDVSGATTSLITGGKFKEIPEAEIAPGMQWTAEPDEDDYYTLEPIPAYDGPEYDEATGSYLIDEERDLEWIVDPANFSKYQSAKLVQTADIALTKPFAGIGAGNAKDNVSWTIGTGDGKITAEEADKRTAAFNAGAFKGTYDGNGYEITNLQLVKDDSHGDYAGFIQSALGATIKNVTIGVNETSLFSPDSGDRGGAIIVGVTVNTTVENCNTLAGSVTVNKAESGIVGYACGGTVIKACTNNLAITTANEKVGGIVACAQKGASRDSALVFGDGTLVIEDCENKGNLKCTTANKEFTAGIASYGDIAITFKGLNSNTGTLTCSGNKVYSVCAQNGGSLTVADGASFHVQAAYMAVRTACDGFNFGMVDGDWINFVKDADVANGMRVMSAGAPVSLTADASITLDETVAQPKVTVPAGYYDAITGAGAAVTHTATAKTTPEITITIDPAIVEWTDGMKLPTPTVKVDGDLAFVGGWDAPVEEPAAGTTNVYTYTVTVAVTDKTLANEASATFKVFKNAPVGPDRPSELNGTSEEIKGEYDKWATKNNVTGDTTAALVDKFILDLPATATEEDVKAALTAEITADMLAAAIASGTPDLTALETKYPNATFQWVEATELTAVDGQSGFWKLTATLKMANGDN